MAGQSDGHTGGRTLPYLKRFGQHFLSDKNFIEKIVGAAGVKPGDRCLEIGPGRSSDRDARKGGAGSRP